MVRLGASMTDLREKRLYDYYKIIFILYINYNNYKNKVYFHYKFILNIHKVTLLIHIQKHMDFFIISQLFITRNDSLSKKIPWELLFLKAGADQNRSMP